MSSSSLRADLNSKLLQSSTERVSDRSMSVQSLRLALGRKNSNLVGIGKSKKDAATESDSESE